ncbi:MAG: aspartate-semialdehyde dehydrogenase [Omnitrophica bacterium RIFCSPLOWO2_12_FULL_50_11]|nr:MAG: aspartate-semialdehyde dehydrogenase [Omnitrophica bacterium RIFCSPLOWO2_12_FULL_50_11]
MKGPAFVKKDKYNVAVVGASGAVGQEMVKILEERDFPVEKLSLFGSERSEGKSAKFRNQKVTIQKLAIEPTSFDGFDLVLSSAGAFVSKQFIPVAVERGAVVIDNTSAFRLDPAVPLVIPEINPEDIQKHKGIIANPNCTAAIMLVAVAPLHRKNRIKRIICATYQSASGAGARAMQELENQTRDYLEGKPLRKEVFPHQIAFNLFSHDSPVSESGYNTEELKVIQESKKILHDDQIRIGITCVRVPVMRAHSAAIYLEFESKMTPREARKILEDAPGVKVVDEPQKGHFPMPIEASGQDQVLVGRIRDDGSTENGLALFVSGDQLRKGAALNAIQIAERLINIQR